MLKQKKFFRKNINLLLVRDDAILDSFLIVNQFIDDFSGIESNSKADTDCLPLSCTVMIKPRAKVSPAKSCSFMQQQMNTKCNNS